MIVLKPKKETIRIQKIVEFAQPGDLPNTIDIKLIALFLENKKKILVYPSSMHEVINGNFFSPTIIQAHEEISQGKIIECELETLELCGVKMCYEAQLVSALKCKHPGAQ